MNDQKRIIALGITGCIGAYKAPQLLRFLQKTNFDVQPVLTEAAQKFVTVDTLETLSNRKAITSLWNDPGELDVKHISLSDSISALLVAPATANCIAKFANGIADDFLSTLYISSKCPVIIAPAMNEKMWQHPATQENIERLKQRGVKFIYPGSGWLACGWEGVGRLAELDDIVELTLDYLEEDKFLSDKKITISAGPTRESIDPMRYISNYSSGKMGVALANRARRAGAIVTLVHGPLDAPLPRGVKTVDVESADEMHKAMMLESHDADVIIMSAAVADYRPVERMGEKLKKEQSEIQLNLTRNEDILADLSEKYSDALIVGFAAETEKMSENAIEKLKRKKLDIIVANSIADGSNVAGKDTTAGLIINRYGRERGVGMTSKDQMASFLLEEIKALLVNESE